MVTESLMTVREFQDRFRIGKTTFYREVAAGRLTVLKIGRSTRISSASAAAWLSALEGSSPSSANRG